MDTVSFEEDIAIIIISLNALLTWLFNQLVQDLMGHLKAELPDVLH